MAVKTEQKYCINIALQDNLFISGVGGTGKSYTLKCIKQSLEEHGKKSISDWHNGSFCFFTERSNSSFLCWNKTAEYS